MKTVLADFANYTFSVGFLWKRSKKVKNSANR